MPAGPVPSSPSSGATSTDGGLTIDLVPPDTTIHTTDTVTGPPPVAVDRRALLERRAAEFELIDPRRDPARYLAMSTRECAQMVDEQTVRNYGTAASALDDDELRRLQLLERGTRIARIDILGDARDHAQVEVRLEGDPVRGFGLAAHANG